MRYDHAKPPWAAANLEICIGNMHERDAVQTGWRPLHLLSASSMKQVLWYVNGLQGYRLLIRSDYTLLASAPQRRQQAQWIMANRLNGSWWCRARAQRTSSPESWLAGQRHVFKQIRL
jgi:hypothetical protein